MRVVIQRVKQASVTVDGNITGSIGKGYLLLVGFGDKDTDADVTKCVVKIVQLRIMSDNQGKMNESIIDVSGELLVVSEFTLYAGLSGRRPDFIHSMNPKEAERLYNYFIEQLKETGLSVKEGVFGAMMDVELVNDGPVTIIYETPKENM